MKEISDVEGRVVEAEFLERRDCQMLLQLLGVYWMLTEYFGGESIS